MEQVNRSSHEGKKTNEIVDFGSFVTTLAKPLPWQPQWNRSHDNISKVLN